LLAAVAGGGGWLGHDLALGGTGLGAPAPSTGA